MEFEFDKEIDTLLRKARGDTAVDTVSTGHIDADAIAAFAENALPQRARALYVSHFADCGRCRQLLAETAAWPPVEPKKVIADEVVSSVSARWYSRLFGMPGLAVALGGLLLVFGGTLAFLVSDRNSGNNAIVARQTENTSRADGPYTALGETGTASNAAAANTSSNAAANTGMAEPQKPSVPPAGNGKGPAVSEPSGTGSATSESAAPEQPKVTAMPPPPVTAAMPPAAMAEPKDADDKSDEREKTAREERSSGSTADLSRDGAPMAMKKAGPNRAAGPRQLNTQNNMQGYNLDGAASGAGEATAVRTAGGKRFERKADGVWYDSVYRGQPAKKVSRGSSAYNKLDSDLRSIASFVGGPLVVVWKGSAYRIQ